jgi:hypothetical protein
MQRVEKLVNAKIPFAVMHYKKTPAGQPRNAFELIVINPANGELNCLPVDPLDVKLIKSRKYHNIIKVRNKTADGQVFEFMEFKQVYDDAVKEFERLISEHLENQKK